MERLEAGAQGIERFFGETTPEVTDVPVDGGARSFVCERCAKTVSLATDADATEAALTLLRQEHDDAHFARDLLDQERQRARPAAPASTAKRKAESGGTGGGKPPAKKGTLASFFKPKS